MMLNMNFEQKGLSSENEVLKAQITHLESALQVSWGTYWKLMYVSYMKRRLKVL